MSLKTIASLVFFFCSILSNAQDWKATYVDALESSKAQNKPIILVFAGSDWCAPCIKMDRSIWQSSEFKTYAVENYILYKADFPRKKSNQLPEEIRNQNTKLAEQFNKEGHFPLVVILDESEKILGKTGYKKLNPESYISLLNTFIE